MHLNNKNTGKYYLTTHIASSHSPPPL